MLAYSELMALERELRDVFVFSVYIDGAVDDPAGKRAWRVKFDNALRDLRSTMDEHPEEERLLMERCIMPVRAELAAISGALGAPGWVAFVTPDGIRYSSHVPAPMPTLAVWKKGIHATPYVRALKESQPVIVVLGDARHVDLFRYAEGRLERAGRVEIHVTLEEPLHMGEAPRNGFHQGVHGNTARDETQRTMEAGTARMAKEAAQEIEKLAGHDGWILLGGISRVAAQLLKLLPNSLASRATTLEALDVKATEAQTLETAREGIGALRKTHDLKQLEKVTENLGNRGMATVGLEDTTRALQLAQVNALFISPRFFAENPDEAESAVRVAFDQAATVEELTGEAAARLDDLGGIAAQLRFPLAATGDLVDTGLGLRHSA